MKKIALINLITKSIKSPFDMVQFQKKKKIFLIENEDELNIVDFGKALVNLGYNVTLYISDVFLPKKTEKKNIKNFRIIYLPTSLKFIFLPSRFPFTPKLKEELELNNFDYCICFENFQIGTIIASLYKKKYKLIVSQEMDKFPRFPFGIIHKFFYFCFGKNISHNVDLYIPKATSARNFLKTQNIINISKENIIWGISDHFKPMDQLQVRKKMKIGNNKILLTVARLDIDKGVDNLIKAMPIILKKDPHILLLIKGSGPLLEKYKKIINKLCLSDSIRIIDKKMSRMNLIELYNVSDLFVLPSRDELFGLAILEALMCGKPIVITQNENAKDLFSQQKIGIMIAKSNPMDLSRAILKILENDKVLNEMKHNAKILSQNLISMKKVALKYMEIIKKI